MSFLCQSPNTDQKILCTSNSSLFLCSSVPPSNLPFLLLSWFHCFHLVLHWSSVAALMFVIIMVFIDARVAVTESPSQLSSPLCLTGQQMNDLESVANSCSSHIYPALHRFLLPLQNFHLLCLSFFYYQPSQLMVLGFLFFSNGFTPWFACCLLVSTESLKCP